MGAAVLESVLVMVVLLLVLFGFLQLFQLSMARAIADFAAFRGARSASVGFRDYLVEREARLKSIPASGVMVEPEESRSFDSAVEQFAYERSVIPLFAKGRQYLEYDHWRSNSSAFHTDYHCPYYGQPKFSGETADCVCSDKADKAEARVQVSRGEESVKTVFQFRNYPFIMPLREAFFKENSTNISSEAAMTNHASSILQ